MTRPNFGNSNPNPLAGRSGSSKLPKLTEPIINPLAEDKGDTNPLAKKPKRKRR